jgi:hypothetical protein
MTDERRPHTAHATQGAETAEVTITVSVQIENRYEHGFEITTYVTDAVIGAPPRATGVEEVDAHAMSEWAYAHVHALTGTGWTRGDAWYDVRVTACSDPALVGKTFAFGY